MANQTVEFQILPSYTLKPVPRLLPWISDFHLSLLLPVAAYWFMSFIFWYIDRRDWFSRYRIHTPEEFKQRNRVTVGEVLRSVLFQQAIQTALGLGIGYLTAAGDYHGREEYDIAVWAGRVHRARDAVPWILTVLGTDAKSLSYHFQSYTSSFGTPVKPLALLNSFVYPHFGDGLTYGFASWEIWIAKVIYWVLEPAARFGIAIFFSDSWQYFWHRAMHSNKWMYRTSFLLPSPHLTFLLPLPCFVDDEYNTQATCTPTTTKSTSPTPLAPSTTPSPKPSSSTPSAPPSPSCSRASRSAKPRASARSAS